MNKKTIAAAGVALMLGSTASLTANAQTATLDTSLTVSGAGATFSANFMEQCKADVKKGLNINVNYQSVGSGTGKGSFISNTVDFAGTDVAFTPQEVTRLAGRQFAVMPITSGGIAIAYRVPGVKDLKFTGPTLAKIFAGRIVKWNASDIATDNPGASLPDATIKVVVRSDSSGTSAVFSDYLATVGKGAWTAGSTQTFPVPPGVGIAQRGSEGTTSYVAGPQGEFGITYAEVSFANELKLDVAGVVGPAGGAPVKPSAESVQLGIGDAAINDDGTLLLNFNSTKAGAYPISTPSYVAVPLSLDPKKGDVLRAFLTYSLTGCQTTGTKFGYAPLPKSLVDLGLATIAKINPGSAPSPTIAVAVAGAAATPTTAVAATTPATTKVTPSTKKSTATTKKRTTATTKKK